MKNYVINTLVRFKDGSDHPHCYAIVKEPLLNDALRELAALLEKRGFKKYYTYGSGATFKRPVVVDGKALGEDKVFVEWVERVANRKYDFVLDTVLK